VLSNPIEKRTPGCVRTFSEASWFNTLEHLPHTSEVWRSIQIPVVVVSKEPQTYLSTSGQPKAASFSKDMYMKVTDLRDHIIYIMTMPWLSQNCLFKLHVYTHRRTRREFALKFFMPSPPAWKISGQTLFSGQAQVAQKSWMIKIYTHYSNFRAHSVFQGKSNFLKNPEW